MSVLDSIDFIESVQYEGQLVPLDQMTPTFILEEIANDPKCHKSNIILVAYLHHIINIVKTIDKTKSSKRKNEIQKKALVQTFELFKTCYNQQNQTNPKGVRQFFVNRIFDVFNTLANVCTNYALNLPTLHPKKTDN